MHQLPPMKHGMVITSAQNPKIKSVLSLQKPRERRKQQLFLIEGHREIKWALEAGYTIGNLFYCDTEETEALLTDDLKKGRLVVPVAPAVFEKIAMRETSSGLVAVAQMKPHALSQLTFRQTPPLVLVIEAVEKPGNLGAMLRTADAAGLDAVIVCDPLTDFYNPNVIRSSVGCVFTVPLVTATSEEAIAWLKNHGFALFATSLQGAVRYDTVNYRAPSAIVMGTEATGLSDIWTTASDANIIIPMRGKIDSMNVSNAAAVVIFEAVRQRDQGNLQVR